MEIEEKINIIEESCKRLVKNEIAELNKDIDMEIERRIIDELTEYQEKEEFAYNKKIEKMEKDYNKKIYSLEMECKKELLNQKNLIQKDLKKEGFIGDNKKQEKKEMSLENISKEESDNLIQNNSLFKNANVEQKEKEGKRKELLDALS